MTHKKFRVTANFPVLGENSHQTVIVEGSTWGVALGKASREFKRMPVMRRRRVTALSMIIEQMESDRNNSNNVVEAGDGDGDGGPVQIEMPVNPVNEVQPEGDDFEEANAQAERLIEEGQTDLIPEEGDDN